jgi:hypothetical protein
MTTSNNVTSLDKFLDKKVFIFKMSINGVGEWNESYHTNATYRGFAQCLDHI